MLEWGGQSSKGKVRPNGRNSTDKGSEEVVEEGLIKRSSKTKCAFTGLQKGTAQQP